MKLQQGTYCPLVKKECLQTKCAWFMQVRGTNPNTGEPVDEWGCAVTWLPILQIETTQQTRQSGAATESMRNEIVKRMDGIRPLDPEAQIPFTPPLKEIGNG